MSQQQLKAEPRKFALKYFVSVCLFTDLIELAVINGSCDWMFMAHNSVFHLWLHYH